MSNKPTPRPRTIRCAIYIRKSTEEGLDQQYNSLDYSHYQRQNRPRIESPVAFHIVARQTFAPRLR